VWSNSASSSTKKEKAGELRGRAGTSKGKEEHLEEDLVDIEHQVPSSGMGATNMVK